MSGPRTLAAGVATVALAFSLGLQPSMSTSTLSPQASPAAADRTSESLAVAVARQATRKFKSLDVAESKGYALLRDMNGIECIAMPGMGAMGVHYVNGDAVGAPSVHLRHPEAVVYERVDGEVRLVALEYVVLKADWEGVHGEGAARPKLFGHRFDFTDAGNRYGLPPFYSLHAWIWKHNPDGMFAMWNPRVHCDCCEGKTGQHCLHDR
jgi:hypothetical protein